MKWFEQVQTEATEYPVDLAEMRHELMIVDTASDTQIRSHMLAARKLIENATGQTINERVIYAFANKFPSETCFKVNYVPVSAVTAIEYIADGGSTYSTFSSSNYLTHSRDGLRWIVELAEGQSWPSIEDRLDAVRLNLTVGYGSTSDVPENIKLLDRDWET